MAEKRRINMSLNLNSALQRQTWEIIRQIPAGRRTNEICRMLCSYEDKRQENLLENIRQIIREELAEATVISDTIESKKTNEAVEPQSVSDDVLGFLRSLQEGDGIG